MKRLWRRYTAAGLMALGSCAPDDAGQAVVPPFVGFVLRADGDSNGDGRGSVGTRPSIGAGKLFYWDGSAFVDGNGVSVSNDGDYNSMYYALAEDLDAAGRGPLYLINNCVGGANFAPDWAAGGTAQVAAQAKTAAALADLGLAQPDLVLINCGINDCRPGGSAIATVRAAVDSYVATVQADYPGVEVAMIQVGRREAGTIDQKLVQMREYLRTTMDANVGVYVPVSACQLNNKTGGYNGDNLHYSGASLNNVIGPAIARFIVNDSLTKYARCWVSAAEGFSSSQILALSAFEAALGSEMDNVLSLIVCKTPVQDNIRADLGLMSWAYFDQPTVPMVFVPNAWIEIPGPGISGTGVHIPFRPDYFTFNGYGVNSAGLGAGYSGGVSGSGGGYVLFGRQQTTSIHRIARGASQVNYAVNDSLTNAGTSSFPLNSRVYAKRIAASGAGAKQIWFNNVMQSSTTAASVAVVTEDLIAGYNDLGGDIGFAANYNCQVLVVCNGALDIATFDNAVGNLLAAL